MSERASRSATEVAEGWLGKAVIDLNLHSSLREQGATSLGPAVLASVAVASRYPGSKVSNLQNIDTFFSNFFPSLFLNCNHV